MKWLPSFGAFGKLPSRSPTPKAKADEPAAAPLIKKPKPTEIGFWDWLKNAYHFDIAIDIGAFAGEYTRKFDRVLKVPTIYAIEPQPDRAEALRALHLNQAQLVVLDCALWDSSGEMAFRLNSHPASSSLLPCHELQTRSFPFVQEMTTILVKTARLDDVVPHEEFKGNVLIKIDAQGAEDRIIMGGSRTFSKSSCVLVEMSYVPMYEGQPLFHAVHLLLSDLGFMFSGIKNQVTSPTTGAPLFAHCIYTKA